MTEKNIFGGGNVNSLYTPLSEDEQEVLERLALSGQYKIVIKDWGHINKPNVRFGDARLQFTFTMLFDRPAVPMPVYYFDMELWTHSGMFLFSKRMDVAYGGHPIQVAAGVELQLAWDIQLKQIDPKVVRAIKPGAVGLTSRLGNMKLDSHQKQQLHKLRRAEAKIRQDDVTAAVKATKKASGR
jgi:hypothetical protein